MTHRALAIPAIAMAWTLAGDPAAAQPTGACERGDLNCLQELHESECVQPAATLQTCLVFLQRLETERRRFRSPGVSLLLGETLQGIARRDVSPQAKERYLRRSRAAYRQVVRDEPFNASGYLGLAEVAETGEERVDWLRGAVRAEHQPVHMELLAEVLSAEIGGPDGDLEAARVIEDAYTFERTDAERWRYAVAALQRYTQAVERYPSATSARAAENVVLRIKEDIDYPQLQRVLLDPVQHLPHLAGAFATLCEKSIAEIVSLDECMAGLELAVATAESPVSAGIRRVLAEAVLMGLRTIAGEELVKAAGTGQKFVEWLERLLATELQPVDVSASLLEAAADYTPDLLARSDRLNAAIALSPNRGDLHLKLARTYVELKAWPEALEELRAAKLLLPLEEHEPVDKLVETADTAYQASFWPPDVVE